MYKLSQDSIRRIIKGAFVSIIKYDLGEIEGNIDFDYHVLPNLKYFPKSDQAILTDYYRDNFPVKQIGKRHNLSYDQIIMRLYKLRIQLKDILEGNITGFDYDYFEEHVFDENVPYYIDKELIYKAWWMFYEEKNSLVKIIKDLGLRLKIKNENNST